MAVGPEDTLDPAHDGSNVENVGAAGITPPEKQDDKKDEVVVSEDGNLIERGGVKYMRAEALHNERQARQRAEAQLAQIEPLIPEINEYFKQKQERQNSNVERTRGTSKGDSPYTDDDLRGYAITRGYQLEDGKPDTARAAQELDIVTGITRRQTQKDIEPLAALSTRDRAQANRERTRGQKFVDGQPVAADKYMDAAFKALPDDYVADSQVSQLTAVIAAGLEYLDHRKNGTLPRSGRGRSGEPMMVERGSGRYESDNGEPSALDIAAARARGKTIEQWQSQSKKANANQLDEV